MNKLHRGNIAPSESTVLSDTDFMESILDNIISAVNDMKTCDETDKIVHSIADILELLNSYQLKKNIKVDILMEQIKNIRNTDGTFMDKKATIMENTDE